jgi:hypothetical protein
MIGTRRCEICPSVLTYEGERKLAPSRICFATFSKKSA